MTNSYLHSALQKIQDDIDANRLDGILNLLQKLRHVDLKNYVENN